MPARREAVVLDSGAWSAIAAHAFVAFPDTVERLNMSQYAPMQPRHPGIRYTDDDRGVWRAGPPELPKRLPPPQRETVRRVVQVASPSGLHMRICSAVVTAVGCFRAKVTVQKDGRVESADSILGLMTMGAAGGEPLVLAATGPDAAVAVDAVAELLASEG